MALDEIATVGRARKFLSEVRPTSIPVPMEAYVDEVGAVLRRRTDLDANEPGFSFPNNGKHYICVNANDRPERQRFTVCHELAHIVLKLPSNHGELPWWSYAKRPLAEVLCDVFAAEVLLPHSLFQPAAEEMPISLATIDVLAGRFVASATSTGSRFANVISAPCAFVLSEQGKVRYASRSKTLRESNAWITPRTDLPAGSPSARVRAGEVVGREEIEADTWLNDWQRGGLLLEETRYLAQWDQTLTLLWFESEEVPPLKRDFRDDWGHREVREDEEELGLEELDGNLRWPSKKRRR